MQEGDDYGNLVFKDLYPFFGPLILSSLLIVLEALMGGFQEERMQER